MSRLLSPAPSLWSAALLVLLMLGVVPLGAAMSVGAHESGPLALAVMADGPDGLILEWDSAAQAAAGPRVLRIALPPDHVAELEAQGVDAAVRLGGIGWFRDQAFQELVLDSTRLPAGWAGTPARLAIGFVPASGALPRAPAAVLSDAELLAGPALPPAPPSAVGMLPEAREPVHDELPSERAGGTPAALFANPLGARAFSAEALQRRRLLADLAPAAAPGGLLRDSPRVQGGAAPAAAGERLRNGGGAAVQGLESGRVKFLVSETGVYRITHELLAAQGIAVLDARVADLRLSSRGAEAGSREIAIHVVDADADGLFGGGDHLEFFGEALVGEERPNLFQGADSTDTNAYFLDALPGPRLRMATRSAAPAGEPLATDFLATIHVEQDNIFLGNHRVGTFDIDHYYWCPSLIWTGGPAAERSELIDLPGLETASARTGAVRVQALARTSNSGVDPDHRSEVEVNGTLVSDRTADGYVIELHEATGLAASVLTNPSTVLLRLPGAAGTTADRFDLDWIELDYPRRFEAADERLLFDHPGGARVVVSGLSTSDVSVLDVGDTAQPVRLTGGVVGVGSIGFSLDAAALGPHAVAGHPATPTFVPALIEWVPDSGLRDPALSVDVVVVGPRAWLEPPLPALARWVADREGQGLAVRLVPTETMVDEFADGLFTPFALSYFLTAAHATWARPPAYGLLLGDATIDWKNDLAERNRQPSDCSDFGDPCAFNELAWVQHVPTRLLDAPSDQLFLGFFASDVALSMVVGSDALPDVNLGRLPARTAAEAGQLLDRVLAYEAMAAAPPDWASRILHVADAMSPSEEAIEGSLNESYAAFVPPEYARTTLFYQSQYGAMNPETFTDDLVAAWTGPPSSAGIVCYVGHGNTFRWSSDTLLGNRESFPVCRDDVDRVTGPLLPTPFVLNANCISGGFMHQIGPSLLEELVRASDGGAIAAFGPTGITDLAVSRTVLNAFHAAVHGPDGRGLRVGDIVLRMQLALAGNLAWEELFNNVLLGDPTLRLIVPSGPPALALRAVAGDAVVHLDWDFVDGATEYRLVRSENGTAGPWADVATVAAPQLTLDDLTVVNGQLYHYALEPRRDGWPGRWSERASARPCSLDPPAPPGPVNVASQPVPGSLRLTWAASPTPGVFGYVIRVYRGPDFLEPPEQIRTSSGGLMFLSGLSACATYTFRVTAKTWCDVESLTSSEAIHLVQPCPIVLDPPAFVRDLRVRREGASDLALAWSPVTTRVSGAALMPDHYTLHRSDRPDFYADAATELAQPLAPGFTDPGRVGAGAALEFYLVAAVDDSGRRGGLGHDLPQGVAGLAATPVASDYQLTWTPVTRDIQGRRTAILRYHVHASVLALDRNAVELLVPVATVLAPSVTVPQVLGPNHFVVAEDVHGSLSAW